MAGDIDNVVAARQDRHVALVVEHGGVTRVEPLSLSFEAVKVARLEALCIVPQPAQGAGCERTRQNEVAHRALGHGTSFVVDDLDVHADLRETG